MNPPRSAARGTRLATWLVTLIAACVLPLVAVAAWLAYAGVAAQQAEREREAANRTQNVATAIDQLLLARLGALQMLASSPLFDDPSRWGELYREAQRFHASFGSHVVVAGAGDSTGGLPRMLMNTRVPFGSPLPPLPRPRGRFAASVVLETGQPAVGDLFPGPVAKEPLVALAVPVPVPAGGRLGLVVLSTPEARQFQQRLDQFALPPEWALSLLDSRGDVIARRAPAGFVPSPEATTAGRYQAMLTVAPWRVVLDIPPQVLQRPARHAVLELALTVGAAALLAVGGGMLAARRLRRAVAALADPGAAASPGILEIDRARQQLLDAAHRRDTALAAERAADAQLLATFELANVGMAHVAPDGRWLRVNRRLCQMLGYAPAELLATTFQDITHPDDLNADLAQVQQLLAGEIPAYAMDKRYRHRDGSEVWAALSVALVRQADGTPSHFISVVEDISKRKRMEQRAREQIGALARSEAEGRRMLVLAERSRVALLNVLEDQRLAVEALRSSETYRSGLFEQLADAVLLVDARGRVLDANPRAEAMFGCAPGELTTLRLIDLLAESERARLADEMPRLMDGSLQITEWDQLRRDGSLFPAEVSARAVDAQRFVAVLRDISGRRQAEQAMLRYQVDLSELTQRLMAQERATTQRVAQALHDRLGQTLALARLRLGVLALRHGSTTAAEHDDALTQLGGLLEQAVAETRQVLADLRPPLLEDQGLAAALDNELQRPGLADGTGAVPALELTPAAQTQRWAADAEYAAFMVAREAVANALRHARARSIVVRLDGGPKGLRLEVDDDGTGLAPSLARGRPGHLGIVGMRERALAVGARFTIAGRPEGGTRVTFTWGALQP